MKRDDKCIDKMIKTEMKKTAEISNSIVNSFKKIFCCIDLCKIIGFLEDL